MAEPGVHYRVSSLRGQLVDAATATHRYRRVMLKWYTKATVTRTADYAHKAIQYF